MSKHFGVRRSSFHRARTSSAAGQTKFRADVPGELAPPPTKGLMAVVLVTAVAEKLISFDVSENVQHPERFAVDAAGRGDYSREEGTATVRCKVAVTVFGDLFRARRLSARSRS